MVKKKTSSFKKKVEKSPKIEKVMREYKTGELHSGSKIGPVVKNPKQAIAIALSEARHSVKKKVKRAHHAKKAKLALRKGRKKK